MNRRLILFDILGTKDQLVRQTGTFLNTKSAFFLDYGFRNAYGFSRLVSL